MAAGQTLDETKEATFEAAIGPHLTTGYRLALAMLRDPVAAEDAVQEAAIKSWRNLSQLRTGAPARPWFLAIVANECRTARRRPWWRVVRLAQPPQSVRSSEMESVERSDIERALSSLGRDDRALLFMHFYLDLPLVESAQALGITPAAAKGRLYRACHRLRPGLELEEG